MFETKTYRVICNVCDRIHEIRAAFLSTMMREIFEDGSRIQLPIHNCTNDDGSRAHSAEEVVAAWWSGILSSRLETASLFEFWAELDGGERRKVISRANDWARFESLSIDERATFEKYVDAYKAHMIRRRKAVA